MVGRLASCLHAVVAAAARAFHLRVIETSGGHPRRCRMAFAATIGAQDMLGCFCAAADARASHMASDAISRRALEHAADVAGLAARVAMRAGQLEPAREVIEACTHRAASTCLSEHRTACEQQRGRYQCLPQAGRPKNRSTTSGSVRHGPLLWNSNLAKRCSGMAALALSAEVAEVHIVFQVTR